MHAKKILLCVSGGIAAYKAIDLASQLHKLGYLVKCVLTEGATKFVSPLNFSAITQESVHTSLFEDSDPIPHIRLADWADLVVIAPATANVLAKAACGIADDLLSAMLLAHTKPVLFIPAMNVNMFAAAVTQENITKLMERGHFFLQPATGMLACGYEGKGKYPPNEEILAAIATYLHYKQDLIGTKVLVTAGATIEPLDPMRYISNRSSGKMGLALARALALRGAEVCLIHANVSVSIPHYLHVAVGCHTAQEMYDEVMKRYVDMDWIIKCAAVADYYMENINESKLPKTDTLILNLAPTKDILRELGRLKSPSQKLIGFAAQTDDLIGKALNKLRQKQLDMICVNNVNTAGADDTTLTIIGAMKGYPNLAEAPELQHREVKGDKLSVSHSILDAIVASCHSCEGRNPAL